MACARLRRGQFDVRVFCSVDCPILQNRTWDVLLDLAFSFELDRTEGRCAARRSLAARHCTVAAALRCTASGQSEVQGLLVKLAPAQAFGNATAPVASPCLQWRLGSLC